jgi:predicted small lipoprotein YifL
VLLIRILAMCDDLQTSVVAGRRHGTATLIAAVLLGTGSLAACGQKGPLTLPAAPAASTPPAAAGAASAPAR